MITRAVGLEREVTVDIETHYCRPGDLYLLCSDGLTDMLSDAAIEDLLKPDALVDQKTLEDVADKLIEAANAAGGADNISIALIVI